MLQLSKARTHCYGMPRNQKQAIYLKEALQKEDCQATWNSESESEKEVDRAHVCFMANNNTPKVTSEPSLDDCELTMDELGEAFEELSLLVKNVKRMYNKAKFNNRRRW